MAARAERRSWRYFRPDSLNHLEGTTGRRCRQIIPRGQPGGLQGAGWSELIGPSGLFISGPDEFMRTSL